MGEGTATRRVAGVRGEKRSNIVLAGFMGTGKSTAGRIAAGRLGMAFVDTDALIEAEAGRSIAAIFATEGEAAFRRLEAAACQRIAAQAGQVIAVGGGALLDAATRAACEANGLVICLSASPDEIVRRIGDDPARPLSGSRAAVERLLVERAAHYASLPHHISTTGRTPERVAEEIIRLWNAQR